MAAAPELITRGWAMAATTLATAASERTLVTHWFRTGSDDSVNADEHFGSNERTLRFVAVALPTLLQQLAASAAIVVVPWDLEHDEPTLSVLAITAGMPTAIATRAITHLGASAAPFWRLEPVERRPPAQLAAIASALSA